LISESLRQRNRHEECDAGGNQHPELDQWMGRIGRVESLRELGPGPPNQPKYEYCFSHSDQIQVVVKKPDNLSNNCV
jgi:hypothetical protein